MAANAQHGCKINRSAPKSVQIARQLVKMTYVEGVAVGVGTEGMTADAIGTVTVLVPTYMVLVRWIVVVLVVSWLAAAVLYIC